MPSTGFRRRADLSGVFRISDRSVLVISADAAGSMEEGVGAVGVDVDLDPRLDEMRPRRTLWDLQFQRPVGHAIVVLDLALLLNAQDLVEVHARNGREGRAGLGGGNGEASGVSVFSACCVALGGSSVPLPVCNGGAWACCGVTGFLCEHPVHKMATRKHNERSCAALIPWAPWLRWIQLSCSHPA